MSSICEGVKRMSNSGTASSAALVKAWQQPMTEAVGRTKSYSPSSLLSCGESRLRRSNPCEAWATLR